MKPPRLGVVMDPLGSIHPAKDTTLAVLLEAQSRGWHLQYMELGDLRLRDGKPAASMRGLRVHDHAGRWFELGDRLDRSLGDLDIILMRKDPPIDLEYIAATYILERAETEDVLVTNRPGALRDLNEKVFASWFSDCCPATLVTRSKKDILGFLAVHGAIVLKPVYAMGGRSVFLVREGDLNTNAIIEEVTGQGQRYAVAQVFVPDVTETGDKRILLIDGEPVPQALIRIPPPGDLRANLNVGGGAHRSELDDRDRWICEKIGPVLRDRGLHFVGIDVIGGFLTEINVTSPTGIRQIDKLSGVNIAGDLLDALQAHLRG